MDKSKLRSNSTKNIVVQEPNINNLTGGTKKGKKKSVANDFADISVPTTSIEQNKSKKPTTVTSKKPTSDEEPEKQLYTKKGYTRPDATYTDQ